MPLVAKQMGGTKAQVITDFCCFDRMDVKIPYIELSLLQRVCHYASNLM